MDDLILFPVTEWEIATIPSQAAAFIRFAFLSHALQKSKKLIRGEDTFFKRHNCANCETP